MNEEHTNVERERETIVRAHMDAEARQDLDGAVGVFAKARYEVVPTGEVHDGEVAVRAFLGDAFAAFPDMRFEVHELHHAEHAVLAEVTFVGTHAGPLRGFPPTNRRVSYRMCNVFVFDGADLVTERLYFDQVTLLSSMGLARDPTSLGGRLTVAATHPLQVLGAYARHARRRVAGVTRRKG